MVFPRIIIVDLYKRRGLLFSNPPFSVSKVRFYIDNLRKDILFSYSPHPNLK